MEELRNEVVINEELIKEELDNEMLMVNEEEPEQSNGGLIAAGFATIIGLGMAGVTALVIAGYFMFSDDKEELLEKCRIQMRLSIIRMITSRSGNTTLDVKSTVGVKTKTAKKN